MSETWKPDLPSADMRVLSGSPTPEEAAAIEALLTSMASEWAETKHRVVLDSEPKWMRSVLGVSYHSDRA